MAVIGYVRVSKDRQNSHLQIDALKAAGCEKIYSDHGISGTKTERKGLESVLSALNEGDTFVVWKFDRLGRSTIHLLSLFDEFQKHGINFVSTTQGIDTSTVEGRIFFGQLALFAEYEREMISQRTKAGIEAARKRGKQIGRPRKMSMEDIASARSLLKNAPKTLNEIAYSYGVSTKTLSRYL